MRKQEAEKQEGEARKKLEDNKIVQFHFKNTSKKAAPVNGRLYYLLQLILIKQGCNQNYIFVTLNFFEL
ncbi:MAG: hypothetical protein ACXVNN_08735, partial [Bacteroidia bacterium]